MSAAHQRFSAQTRRSGELDKPDGKRRRNLESGRLSVVFGADPACIIEHLAAEDQRSTGGFVRKLVLKALAEEHGLEGPALAARAAELRAAKSTKSDGACKHCDGAGCQACDARELRAAKQADS